MKNLPIKLCSFQDVWTLSRLASKEKFKVFISDGQVVSNAKSLMCLFSLKLSSPLELQIDCGPDGEEEYQKFVQKMERFLVSDHE